MLAKYGSRLFAKLSENKVEPAPRRESNEVLVSFSL